MRGTVNAENHDLDRAGLPPLPGSYVLILRLGVPRQITVGRLGAFRLEPGYYLYSGSALGPGGLRARVGRHLRADKQPHWHIDVLTAAADITGVWISPGTQRLECAQAHSLAALPGINEPIPGFGASDCGCRTHLFRLADDLLDTAWQALGCPLHLKIAAP
ncbi:MAG: hypothetical protein Kow00124_17380 [Anaerolineae bacterium]